MLHIYLIIDARLSWNSTMKESQAWLSCMVNAKPAHDLEPLLLTWINSSPPGQNGRHFADDIFRSIFMNEKFSILNKISLKFVPHGPTDNNPALV